MERTERIVAEGALAIASCVTCGRRVPEEVRKSKRILLASKILKLVTPPAVDVAHALEEEEVQTTCLVEGLQERLIRAARQKVRELEDRGIREFVHLPRKRSYEEDNNYAASLLEARREVLRLESLTPLQVSCEDSLEAQRARGQMAEEEGKAARVLDEHQYQLLGRGYLKGVQIIDFGQVPEDSASP